MKTIGRSLRLAAGLSLVLGMAGPAYAFHSGGVAECEGCHSMHNSFEGSSNVTGGVTGPYLLKAQDQSGACLNCHGAGTTLSSYHVSTEGIAAFDGSTPQQMTPGGDFSWLKKDMTATIRGRTALQHGERRGHNVVAVDFGYEPDTTLTVAPGGTYPAANLHCSSCHDPHGRFRRFAGDTFGTSGLPISGSGSYFTSSEPVPGVYAVGAYRLLAGVGYRPKSLTGSFAFTANPMDALAPSSYNRAESSNIDHRAQTAVGYMGNTSEWCANCHVAMLQGNYTSGMRGLRHPAGNGAKLTAAIVANYNAYVSSGVMTNAGLGYSTLVPTEIGSVNYVGLKGYTGAWGATLGYSNVSCLTCHRAHASGFESMLRFSYLNEFMTIGDAAGAAAYDPSTTENKINLGFSASQQQRAYYDRPASLFGPWARALCNRCHAKD